MQVLPASLADGRIVLPVHQISPTGMCCLST
jgi:hypothetical protein